MNTASGVAGVVDSGFSNMAQGVKNAFSGGVNSLYSGGSNPSANMQGQGMNPMSSMNSPGTGYGSGQQNGYNSQNLMQQQQGQYGQPQTYSSVQSNSPSSSFGR